MIINFKSHFLISKMIIKSKINQIKIKQELLSAFKLTRVHQEYFVRCVWESLTLVNVYITFLG